MIDGRTKWTHCRQCGNPLPPRATRCNSNAGRAGYCGATCYATAIRGTRTCRGCGVVFLPVQGNQHYHDTACQLRRRAQGRALGRQASRACSKHRIDRPGRVHYRPTIRWCCGMPYPFHVEHPTNCPRCGWDGLVRQGAA